MVQFVHDVEQLKKQIKMGGLSMTRTKKLSPDEQIKKLKDENKELKTKLEKIRSKEPCWHCGGTGKKWTYWDGDTWCRDCSGTGML